MAKALIGHIPEKLPSPHLARPLIVLIVHEDASFRAAAESALTQAGFGVVAVPNSMTAIGVLGREALISCLITTMRMPRGHPHGLALARIARQHCYQTVVIFLAGKWSEPNTNGLLLDGAPAIVCPEQDVAGLTNETRRALRSASADQR